MVTPSEFPIRAVRKSRFTRPIFAVFLGAILLLSPAIINGRPFIFWDTALYLGLGELLTADDPTTVIASLQNNPAIDNNTSSPDRRRELIAEAASHLGARSVVYSVFLREIVRHFSMWGAAFIECLTNAAALYIISNLLLGRAIRMIEFAALIVGLAFLTPLGITSNLLLPDALTAPMILFVVALLCFWSELKIGSYAAIGLALIVCVLCHPSHGLIAICMCLAAIPILKIRGPSTASMTRPIAMTLGFVAIALIATIGIRACAGWRMGAPLHNPPTVMAKLIDDGPGSTLLIEDCSKLKFAVCRYADRILQAKRRDAGDAFIWSVWPGTPGTYLLVPEPERARLRDEQVGFLRQVLVRYPLHLVASSAGDAFKLMLAFKTDGPLSKISFTYGVYKAAKGWLGTNLLLSSLPNAEGCRRQPQTRCGTLPLGHLAYIHYATVAIAFSFLLALKMVQVLTRLWPADLFGKSERAFLMVLVGVISNDAVCGILAGPWDRFSSRVIWLIPAMGSLTLILRGTRSIQFRQSGDAINNITT